MAGKTVSQRLEDLAARVGDHIPQAELRMGLCEKELLALADDIRELEALPHQIQDLKERVKHLEDLPQMSARHDERLKAVEKGHDRLWQVAPMVISVAAILVSVVVAFAKK